MVTILSVVICLHHMCAVVTVPTSVSLTQTACTNLGHSILERTSKNWRVVGFYCEDGRDV
jgi:hypothetical protein